jgi:hypothetical protein
LGAKIVEQQRRRFAVEGRPQYSKVLGVQFMIAGGSVDRFATGCDRVALDECCGEILFDRQVATLVGIKDNAL